MTDLEYMHLAIEQAQAAALRGEVPIGALVVLEDRILAAAGNRTITDCDPTAHAEIVALREAAREAGNHRLTGAALYVTIEPCAMCAGALVQARIARLIYGADEPKGGAIRTCMQVLDAPALNHRVEVTPGFWPRKTAALVQSFFSDPADCPIFYATQIASRFSWRRQRSPRLDGYRQASRFRMLTRLLFRRRGAIRGSTCPTDPEVSRRSPSGLRSTHRFGRGDAPVRCRASHAPQLFPAAHSLTPDQGPALLPKRTQGSGRKTHPGS